MKSATAPAGLSYQQKSGSKCRAMCAVDDVGSTAAKLPLSTACIATAEDHAELPAAAAGAKAIS